MTIGGVSLFPVSAVTLANSITNGVTLSQGALSVGLGNSPLDVTLSALIDAGTTFQEIDLISYSSLTLNAGASYVEEDSFAQAHGQALTVTAGGGGVATFGYAALEIQSWTNGVSSVAGFTSVNHSSAFGTQQPYFPSGPAPAPATVPADVLTLTPTTFYVRFVGASGSVLTASGAQYFVLDAAANGVSVPSQLQSGTFVLGQASFGPLSLALSDTAVAPALLSQLTAGTPLAEIDVLGYNATGTLVQRQSFGFANVNNVELTAGGTLQLAAAYVTQAQQQSYAATTASGTLSTSWNSATNTTGFSNGFGGTVPMAAPVRLPVIGSTPHLDYYVQLYSPTGAELTLDGGSLFRLDGFSAGAASVTSSGGTGGSVTLAPLNLTIADPALAANLLGNVMQTSSLGEIDVLGYNATTGALASQATFGHVRFTAAAVNSGTLQLTAACEATAVQQFSGSGLAQAGWNATNGTASYFGIDKAAATLPTGQLAATAPSIDYYAHFILSDGSSLTVDGQQLFALSGYAAGGTTDVQLSTGATFVPSPLTLSLSQGALTPSLLADLVRPGVLSQVDVLGYSPFGYDGLSTSLLLSDQSFLAPSGGGLSVQNSGTASLVLNYASESTQYSATGLPPDPGPGAAAGALTVAPGQSTDVTALLNSLITPGVSGDTDSIVAVGTGATLSAGTVSYVAPTTTGSNSFNYTVQNELGQTATGTVDVTVTAAALCVLRGTHIATPGGEVLVETLRIGDLVRTVSGAARPIRWIGFGRTLITPHNRDRATPVVVRRHALGEFIPHRDLYITRGHALYLAGVLIPVEELINHRSIAWADSPRVVEYYHLELDRHDVVLAENAPVESYREADNAELFLNTADRPALLPQAVPPYAPVLHEHPTVKRVWRQLSARAGRLEMETTADADVHLLADGVRLEAAERRPGRWCFRLHGPVSDLRIASRSAIPAMLGLDQDQRRLGIALERIVLCGARRRLTLRQDDRRLVAGFHGVEPGADRRWTDGEAALPAAVLRGLRAGAVVELHGGTLPAYPLDEPELLLPDRAAPLHGRAAALVRAQDLNAARRVLWQRRGYALTAEAGVRFLADDCRALRPRATAPGRVCLTLPPGTRTLRLASRQVVAAAVDPALPAQLPLGVAVAAVAVDGAALPLDHPRLATGWHAPERGVRWTDGAAVLSVAGARQVDIGFAAIEVTYASAAAA